ETVTQVPFETLREIPKEVVKEVTNEVVKEVKVPASLTEKETILIELGSNYLSADTIRNMDDGLFGMGSVSVSVDIPPEVSKIVSEEVIRNRFELVLRKNNVLLQADAPLKVQIEITGRWDPEDRVFFNPRPLRLYR